MTKKQGETDKREMIFRERLKQTRGYSVLAEVEVRVDSVVQ